MGRKHSMAIWNTFRNSFVVSRGLKSGLDRNNDRHNTDKESFDQNRTSALQKVRKLLRISNLCLRRWQLVRRFHSRRILLSVFLSTSGHISFFVQSRARKCQVRSFGVIHKWRHSCLDPFRKSCYTFLLRSVTFTCDVIHRWPTSQESYYVYCNWYRNLLNQFVSTVLYFRYTVKATLDMGRLRQSVDTESTFTVVGILDLNLEPESLVMP